VTLLTGITRLGNKQLFFIDFRLPVDYMRVLCFQAARGKSGATKMETDEDEEKTGDVSSDSFTVVALLFDHLST
jgi:hypothetical protein